MSRRSQSLLQSYASTTVAPQPVRRFSSDGSPLSLFVYLASKQGDLRFKFRHGKKQLYLPLEEDVDRRVAGRRVGDLIFKSSFFQLAMALN